MMEKLVMCYTVSDECTYSYDMVIPFDYESLDKAEYDFLITVESTPMHNSKFEWANHAFDKSDFYYETLKEWKYRSPTFYALDDWFSTYNRDLI